jgi:hypothetical protein
MTDEDMEVREGSGGWMIPESPDKDGCIEALLDECVAVQVFTGYIYVYLEENDTGDIHDIVRKYGYTINKVEPIKDGHFVCKVIIGSKDAIRHVEDAYEHRHRVDTDDE